MAAIAGIKGAIQFPQASDLTGGSGAHQVQASRWSASIDRDVFDASPFDPTSLAKVSVPGLHVMTGTIEGFLDDTTGHDYTHFQDTAATASMVLTATTGRTYTFTGIISNWSASADSQGVNTYSCSFQSSGAIVIA